MITVQMIALQEVSPQIGVVTGYSYRITGMSDWSPFDPNNLPPLPQGKDFYFGVRWRNTSNYPARALAWEATIIKPNGAYKDIGGGGMGNPISPGAESLAPFAPFNLDMYGTYQAMYTVLAEVVPSVGIVVYRDCPRNSLYRWNFTMYIPTKSNPQIVISSPNMGDRDYFVYPYSIGSNVSATMDGWELTLEGPRSVSLQVTITDGGRYIWTSPGYDVLTPLGSDQMADNYWASWPSY